MVVEGEDDESIFTKDERSVGFWTNPRDIIRNQIDQRYADIYEIMLCGPEYQRLRKNISKAVSIVFFPVVGEFKQSSLSRTEYLL